MENVGIRRALFQPVEPSDRLCDKVVEQIIRLVDEGILKVGDKLPSERDLSRQFSVGRTSVREALRTLEALRIIETRPGTGAFIINTLGNRFLSSRWNWLLAQRKEDVLGFIETREALEPKASALAAIRASEEDIQNIRNGMEKMEKGVENEDIVLMVEGDIEFHDRISQAAKNQTLIDLNHILNRLLLETRYAFFDIPGTARESCRQHRAIFETILLKDSDAAGQATMQHVLSVRARITSLIEKAELKIMDGHDGVPHAVTSLGYTPQVS